MERVDPDKLAELALKIADRELTRLAEKEQLTGWEIQDLDRLFSMAARASAAERAWLEKINPEKFTEEQWKRIERMFPGGTESDGAASKPAGRGRRPG